METNIDFEVSSIKTSLDQIVAKVAAIQAEASRHQSFVNAVQASLQALGQA